MATSMQVEPEPSVERALQQVAEMEGKEEGDPLEGLGNKEIDEIYYKLTPEDRHLFRQFKRFHKLHYELYGHDALSYKLAHRIMNEMFSGILATDAEVIAAARNELLAAERLKSLYKQLGLAVLMELQQSQRVEAPEYPPPPQPLQFPSRQEEQWQQAQPTPQPDTSEADIKPDVKLPRRLATTYLGRPGLLCMVGAGDEDHIITRVIPGTDPLQQFDEDDPNDVITIDHETDESDIDDLSEVSMTSADAMTKEELQGLLANVAASQQKAAEAIDTLAAHVGKMTTDQVSEAAATMVAKVGHV